MNRQQALETLGLTAAATPEEIRQAYNRQIGQLDGIASMNPAPALLETVRQTRVKLEAAWAVLGGSPAAAPASPVVASPVAVAPAPVASAPVKSQRKPVSKGVLLVVALVALVAVGIYQEVPQVLRARWAEWQLQRRQEKFETVWKAEIKPATDTYTAKIDALLPELVGYQTLRQLARDQLGEEKQPVAQAWYQEQVRLSEDFYQRLIDPLFHGRDLVAKSHALHEHPGGNYEDTAQTLREYVAVLSKIKVQTVDELSAAWVKDYMLPLARFSWPNREHFELLWTNAQASLVAELAEAMQRTETANPASPVTPDLLLDLGYLTEVRDTELKPRFPDIDAVLARAQTRWPQVFSAMEWMRFPDVAMLALIAEARAAEQAKDWPRCLKALRAIEEARPRADSPERQLLPAFDAYIVARLLDLGRADDAYPYQQRLADRDPAALAWVADYDFKIGRHDRALAVYEKLLAAVPPESLPPEAAHNYYTLCTTTPFHYEDPPVTWSARTAKDRAALYLKADEFLLRLAKRDDELGRWAKEEYADTHSDRIFKPAELSVHPSLASPLKADFPTDPEIMADQLRLKVEFVVNARGRAEDFSLSGDAPHPAFLAALRTGLPTMKFTPGKFRDRAVKTTFSGVVEFKRPVPLHKPVEPERPVTFRGDERSLQRTGAVAVAVRPSGTPSAVRAAATGSATVIIYRIWRYSGLLYKIKVAEDGRQIAAVPNKTYVQLTLPAGRHTFKSSFTMSKAVTETFDFEPGRTYYIQTEIAMGAWSSKCPLTLTDEATARAAMSAMKQVSAEGN